MNSISFQKPVSNYYSVIFYFPYCSFYLNWYWMLIASSALNLYGGNPYEASVTLFNNAPLRSVY